VPKLTEGQAHDGRSALDMMHTLGKGQILMADRAYDRDPLRRTMTAQGAWANIKPMPNRVNVRPSAPSCTAPGTRSSASSTSSRTSEPPPRRYEKHATNFLARIELAATRSRIRAIESGA
jgi:transposase